MTEFSFLGERFIRCWAENLRKRECVWIRACSVASQTMSYFSPHPAAYLISITLNSKHTHTHGSCDNISLPLQVIFSFHLKLNEFSASIGLMIHSVIFVLLCLSISSFQSKTHFIAPWGIFHIYNRKQPGLSLVLSVWVSQSIEDSYELVDCLMKRRCHWGEIQRDYKDLWCIIL